ncbi:LysR family transcriptional regulator [Paenibacillus sp. WLX2291]|uniref:LysR family transcriptional regulator n=1 Tax=Paenibacillus sp. WLX2291 TaxID=3296934 RepID=UPI0039842E74
MLHQLEGKYIHTFLKVYEYRNISKASSVLGFSQSSITNHIQILEHMIGAKLFDRKTHGVTPTDKGEIFAKYAHQFSKLAQEMNDEVHNVRNTIKVKALESFCVTQLYSPLVQFLALHPNLDIELTTGFQQQIVDDVINLKVEYGIVPFDPQMAQLEYTPILQEEFMFVCAANMDPEHIMQQELRVIGFGNNCMYQSLTDQILKDCGKRDYRNITYASLEMIKQTVMGGAGIALMPKRSVESELQSAQLQRLDLGEPVWIQHGMVEHRSARRNTHAAVFKQFMMQFFVDS